MAANSQFSMAVHVLTMLARSEGQNVKSEYLAGSVNTNAVVVRRLLSQLGNANLVTCQTGSAGGARLAQNPAEIRLADIYHAVECGEVFALHRRGANKDCPVGRNIEAVLCNLQKAIDHAVDEKLAEYTLGDVLAKIEETVI